MWNWIKGVLSPKTMVSRAIDALDYFAPLMAAEIDRIMTEFNKMDSTKKAEFVIEKTQAWLRKRFGV